MNRISRHEMFMSMAEIVAQRSTCLRGQVGCVVIVKQYQSVAGIGYNGPPPMEPHCDPQCRDTYETGCVRSTHAEINALHDLHHFQDFYDFDLAMYVTTSPCNDCFKVIKEYEVQDVVFRSRYRNSSDFFSDTTIGKWELTEMGRLIKHTGTGEIEGF